LPRFHDGLFAIEEKDKVMDWLNSNFDIEYISFGKSRPMVRFITITMKGFDVVSAILDQNEFGVRYIQDNPVIYVHSSI
jgi:hypothetical protein